MQFHSVIILNTVHATAAVRHWFWTAAVIPHERLTIDSKLIFLACAQWRWLTHNSIESAYFANPIFLYWPNDCNSTEI